MVLKAVLFDFNGVIIKDEAIHRELNDELLIAENLPPQGKEFWKVSVGRSDRAALTELLKSRGRFVTDEYLDKLIAKETTIIFVSHAMEVINQYCDRVILIERGEAIYQANAR